MKKPLIVLASSLALATIAPAGTVAHWLFNDLTDSSGNGHTLTNTNSSTTISGGKANFTGAGSGVAGNDLLSAADHAAWDDVSFTVETIFTFNAPTVANISTLVAHLSNGGGRQWLLGTNAANNPILILRNDAGTPVETAFDATFGALVSGNTYYLGAAVDLTAVNPADRITFYFRDITNNGAFRTSNISTTFTGLADSSSPVTFGSTGHSSSRLTGSIDEARFSDLKLGPNDLLIAPIPEPSAALLSIAAVSLLGLRRKRA